MSAADVVRTVLVGAAGVTALVAQRVYPKVRVQGAALPNITLRVPERQPTNHLRGHGNLDMNTVEVNVWATTQASADAVAGACLAAMNTAGHQLQMEINDDYDPDIDPGVYNIRQMYRVWT